MQGLYFKLIGVINDATGLSESLKRHGSIRVINDTKKGGQFAMVEFMRTEDGSFIPPTTELTEKDINFFLVEVVNTYMGAEMIVRTGDKEKPREIRVDKFGNQHCKISKAGTIIRVSRWGKVEIFHVTSPTVNNRKYIKTFPVFEDNLPFENSSLLDAVIKDEPVLKQFESDIKKAYDTIKEAPKFENKMNLSEVKYNLLKDKKREFKPVNPEIPPKVEDLIAKSETDSKPKDTKPETEKTKPRKGTPKKGAKGAILMESREKDDKKEILDAKKGNIISLTDDPAALDILKK